MKTKATIYDFQRYFKAKGYDTLKVYFSLSAENIEKTNEEVITWCKANPLETRQERFLKMFPNAEVTSKGVLRIAPCVVEKHCRCEDFEDCIDCKEKYWLAEAEE